MTTKRRRLLVLGPIAALVFAACGPAAEATPDPGVPTPVAPAPEISPEMTPEMTPDMTPEMTPEMPGEASPTPGEGAAGTPDAAGGFGELDGILEDPELAASIPESVNGTPIVKSSLGDADFGPESPMRDIAGLVQMLGTTPDAIAVAAGTGEGDAGRIDIVAMSVAGLDAETLRSTAAVLMNGDPMMAGATTETVGGKNVIRVTDPNLGETEVFVYATGDRLYLVAGPAALAEPALEELPA
jgi:hypothetical protein